MSKDRASRRKHFTVIDKEAWNSYGKELADALLTMRCFGGGNPLEMRLLVDAYAELSNREKNGGSGIGGGQFKRDQNSSAPGSGNVPGCDSPGNELDD